MGADGEGCEAYWDRIDDVKALVEPFPLVPAIWIGLNFWKSDGCRDVSIVGAFGLFSYDV